MYYPWWMNGSTPYAPQMNYTAAYQGAQEYKKQLEEQALQQNMEEIKRLEEKIQSLTLAAAQLEQNRKLIEQLQYKPPEETAVLYADDDIVVTAEPHPLWGTKYYAHTNQKTEKAESVRTEEEPKYPLWLTVLLIIAVVLISFGYTIIFIKNGGFKSPVNRTISLFWLGVYLYYEFRSRKE